MSQHQHPCRRRPPLAALFAVAIAVLGPLPVLTAPAASSPDLFDPETVIPVSRQDFLEVLEHHRGEVILVNFWATWCIPCIQELPELDELQHRYREQGLKVIGVSFDDLDRLEEQVRPFFAKTAPRLVSYIQTEDDPYTFAEALDPDWVGSLPTSFMIDRGGKVRKAVAGRLTFRAFEDVILPLLEEE